jgi:hypothetical protein
VETRIERQLSREVADNYSTSALTEFSDMMPSMKSEIASMRDRLCNSVVPAELSVADQTAYAEAGVLWGNVADEFVKATIASAGDNEVTSCMALKRLEGRIAVFEFFLTHKGETSQVMAEAAGSQGLTFLPAFVDMAKGMAATCNAATVDTNDILSRRARTYRISSRASSQRDDGLMKLQVSWRRPSCGLRADDTAYGAVVGIVAVIWDMLI